MSKVLNFTGNRGEWSEPYAFMYLLGNPQLQFCNGSLIPAGQNRFQIKTIEMPSNAFGGVVQFSFSGTDVVANFGQRTSIVSQSNIRAMTNQLFSTISNSSQTTFSFHQLDNLWNLLLDPEIKSNSTIKYDIKIEIYDVLNKTSKKYGFSIKSNLGSATSLLNASQMTNFTYSLKSKISLTNSTPKKLGKAVKNLQMSLLGADSTVFKANLHQIDPDLEKIIMHSLLEYYGNSRVRYVKDVLDLVKASNPLSYSNLSKYDDIFGLFLEATAFGMVPNSLWNKVYGADGGMLVVTQSGDVVFFFLPDQISNAACKNFLIKYSYFDTASTSRHSFGSIINGNQFKLNLLIRL
jgi:type II restriction enzyme